MKTLAYCLVILVSPFGLFAEAQSDILNPQKRAETTDLARTLLTIKLRDLSDEALAPMNPFNPLQPVDENEQQKVPESSAPTGLNSRDLLKNIADGLSPTGMMQLGGNAVLLFGQKKFKVGERIAVTYQDVIYEVEVSAIEKTNFTLRLKNDEITRPIKASVKKK